MRERWSEFETAYADVRKAQDVFWNLTTQLRAGARVSQPEINAAVQAMDAAHRVLQELGRSLLSSDSGALIWTAPREHR